MNHRIKLSDEEIDAILLVADNAHAVQTVVKDTSMGSYERKLTLEAFKSGMNKLRFVEMHESNRNAAIQLRVKIGFSLLVIVMIISLGWEQMQTKHDVRNAGPSKEQFEMMKEIDVSQL